MKEPILVPMAYESFNSEGIKLVVIIEKDAIFKSFCHLILKSDDLSSVLLVTGKGYPDNLTKKFVNHLTKLGVPIWGFMDSDIYGLHIFKSFINSNQHLFEFKGFWLVESDRQNLITIKIRDFKLMQNFLINSHPQLNDVQLNIWRREIQRGLILFKKAEMEVRETIQPHQDPNSYIYQAIHSFIHYDESFNSSWNTGCYSSLTVADPNSQYLLSTPSS